MRTFIAFVATTALACTFGTVALAAQDGAPATQGTSIPIDTTKGLTPPPKAATTKNKSRSSSAAHASKKKVTSKATRTATARCNDGAQYFSKERRGACASHGGVKTWYVW